jgi:hypothetical protein
MIANLAAIGILLNISRASDRVSSNADRS